MTNDGRIVSSNENLNGELSNWKNITSLNSLIGVCKDGTVRSCIKSFEKNMMISMKIHLKIGTILFKQ